DVPTSVQESTIHVCAKIGRESLAPRILLQKVMCANWRLDIRSESHASLRTKELLGYVTFSHAGRAILSLQPIGGSPWRQESSSESNVQIGRLDIRFEFKSDQKSTCKLKDQRAVRICHFLSCWTCHSLSP
ncbi:hypothetical protein HID58_093393, partial [Brassica napus]